MNLLLHTILVITWVQILHNAVSGEDFSDGIYDMITKNVISETTLPEENKSEAEYNNRVEHSRNVDNESILDEGSLKRIRRYLVPEHERYPLHPQSIYFRSTRRPHRNNKRNSKLEKLRFYSVFKAIKKLIPKAINILKLPKFSKKRKGKAKGKGKGEKKHVDINADVNVDSDDGSNDGEKQLLSIFKSYLSDSSRAKNRSNLSGTPILQSKKRKRTKKKSSKEIKGTKGRKPTKVTTESPKRPWIDNLNLDFNVKVDLSNKKQSTNETNESEKETLKKKKIKRK